MPLEVSLRLRFHHQDKGVKKCELVKRFPNYLKSNIYINAKLPDETAKTDGRILYRRRSKALIVRDKRKIVRTMLMLRETLGSFSIKRLQLAPGVDPHLSDNTIIRVLKCNKYTTYNHKRKV